MKKLLVLSWLVAASGAWAADTVLNGSFTRSGGKDTGDLKATLTPDGAGQWKVVYDFQWKGKPTQYVGTIKGDLKDGVIAGDAATKDGKRTWEIKGAAKGGVLKFDHWETTKGGRKVTGDATLQP
jgi:hypothetical protein